MSWVEIAGFVTGALCVWLIVRENPWNFPVGMANNGLFIVVFVDVGLYADAGLQIVYVGLAVLGWHWWLHGGPPGTGVDVHLASPWILTGCVALVLAVTAVLHWVLATYTGSTVAMWDALTTALSLVAQLMLSRKWMQNWWFWIAADVGYIGLYAAKDLWLTAALYVVFLGLCVVGLRRWRATVREQQARAPVEAAV